MGFSPSALPILTRTQPRSVPGSPAPRPGRGRRCPRRSCTPSTSLQQNREAVSGRCGSRGPGPGDHVLELGGHSQQARPPRVRPRERGHGHPESTRSNTPHPRCPDDTSPDGPAASTATCCPAATSEGGTQAGRGNITPPSLPPRRALGSKLPAGGAVPSGQSTGQVLVGLQARGLWAGPGKGAGLGHSLALPG